MVRSRFRTRSERALGLVWPVERSDLDLLGDLLGGLEGQLGALVGPEKGDECPMSESDIHHLTDGLDGVYYGAERR
ncbi:MAG: hypothetical protein QW793_06210 [Candidatus Caldarchaeum sp.]